MTFTRAVARSRTEADVSHTVLFRSGPLRQSGKSAAAAPDIASSKDTKVAIFNPRLLNPASRRRKTSEARYTIILERRGLRQYNLLHCAQQEAGPHYGSASVQDCHCGFMEHADPRERHRERRRGMKTRCRLKYKTSSTITNLLSCGCLVSVPVSCISVKCHTIKQLSPHTTCALTRLLIGYWIKE